MTFSKQYFLYFIGLLVLACCCGSASSEEFETVTVNVQVFGPDGSAIENAPVEVGTHVQSGFAMTDGNGEGTIEVLKGPNEDTVIVRITHGGFTPLVPPELRQQAITRFHELQEQYAVPTYDIVSVTGPQIEHNITFNQPAQVSGRLIDENGSSLASSVAVRGLNSFGIVMPAEDGHFAVNVVKNAPAEIWIAGETTQLHSVTLTAQQTASDIDLGDITVDDLTTDANVVLTMNNAQSLHLESKIKLSDSLGLVSADGEALFLFDVKGDGKAYWTNSSGDPVDTLSIHAGTYYIAPGSLGNRPFLALLESVRDGRQPQLDAAGVPKITVAPGETVNYAFDGQTAVDAIIAVGGDLADP